MQTHTLPRTCTQTNTCLQKERERGKATHGILSQRFGVRTYGFTPKPVVKILSAALQRKSRSKQHAASVIRSTGEGGESSESLRREMMRH